MNSEFKPFLTRILAALLWFGAWCVGVAIWGWIETKKERRK